MIHFHNPEYLLFLLLVPIWGWYLSRKGRTGSLRYSSLTFLGRFSHKPSNLPRFISMVFRLVAVTLLIVALARPQSSKREQEVTTEGIDIVICLDVSGSMISEDFKPKNRLESAKEVAREFIQARQTDRIGLVVFAGRSFTQCPLTTDYGVLVNLLDRVSILMNKTIPDGTAMGMGLANALLRLKDSKAKSKVVILITDGNNNAGNIPPMTAAQMAKTLGVTVHTVCIGVSGYSLIPYDDPFFGRRYERVPVQIDPQLLGNMAQMTGGIYRGAKDEDALRAIYKEIDQLEKTKIIEKLYMRYSEHFWWFLLPGLLLLLLEVFLNGTVWRRIP